VPGDGADSLVPKLHLGTFLVPREIPFRAAKFDAVMQTLYTTPMTIKAVVHQAEEGGYWAEVPALPGCVTQAETLDELRNNLKEAIELWLDL
jgi:hypothetical protein